jgi:uncharacterized protein DUF3187
MAAFRAQLTAISYRLSAISLGLWAMAYGLWAPERAMAQSLPSYAPINPVAASRSGLSTLPYVEPGRKWHVSVLTDYSSIIEYAMLNDVSYVLDAEVLRTQLSVVRSLGRKGFLLAEGSFNGVYDGFLDGFLDWYHKVTGFQVKARELRPTNAFAYEIALQGGRSYSYGSSSGFLGDVRLGGGLRHSSRWQSAVSLTLPTGNSPAGSRRGVMSVNATTTLRSAPGKRLVYEGTLSAGYTPTHGDLADLQHSTFLMVTQGARVRISGPLHAYGNLIYHSAYYQDTGTKALDSRELTLDLGGMLRFKRGPEWMFGLTEDLEPSGPAVDVTFRFGARW